MENKSKVELIKENEHLRKQLQEANFDELQKSEHEFKTLFEKSNDALLIIKNNSVIPIAIGTILTCSHISGQDI